MRTIPQILGDGENKVAFEIDDGKTEEGTFKLQVGFFS